MKLHDQQKALKMPPNISSDDLNRGKHEESLKVARISKDLLGYLQIKKKSGGFESKSSSERFKSDISALKKRLQTSLLDEDAEIATLETEIHVLDIDKIDEDIDWNPWITYHDTICRFLDLNSIDDMLTEARTSDFRRLNEQYQAEIQKLEAQYQDVLGDHPQEWPKDQHFKFCKLRDEYATQSRRLHLLSWRLSKELKGTSKNKLSVRSAYQY